MAQILRFAQDDNSFISFLNGEHAVRSLGMTGSVTLFPMLRDILGHEFDFPVPPRRVVSLVPSITETLFDIGAGDAVVGMTTFCIFPEDAPPEITRVGGTKNPIVEKIRELHPDVVYMNLEENLRRHGDMISGFTRIHVSEPKTIEDVVSLLRDLGQIHDTRTRAGEIISAIEKKQRDLESRERFMFAVPIWKDPWMWCGGDTYVSNLIAAAGGTNVLADEERYPAHSVEEIVALRPDVVFLPDEPYAFEQEHRTLFGEAKVIGPFPGHLFTWHGSRTLLGLEFLEEVL